MAVAPLSLSAAPFATGLRFTFALGDDAAAFRRIRVGTRVWLEGPYGTFTAPKADRPVVLVGGGSGIAPVRALMEDLTPAHRPEVVLRVSDPRHAWFVGELQQLVDQRGGRLHLVYGSRIQLGGHDPFHPGALTALIPDLAQRTAFICGPTGMSRSASRGLHGAGIPTNRIHTERYVY